MNGQSLTQLRKVLAKLYSEEADIRRVSADAGIDLTRIALNSTTINNWYAVLGEAEKSGRVDALLAVVDEEYGGNPEFHNATGTYRQRLDPINAVPYPTPPPEPKPPATQKREQVSRAEAGQHRYELFELEISPADKGAYPIRVLHSASGAAHAQLRLPFGPLELSNQLKDIEIALLRSSGLRRHSSPTATEAARQFGEKLFEALIAGEVRRLYDSSRQLALQQGHGLRIRLRLQTPELAVLPWEFLFDPRPGEFVCLSRATPLVRYLEFAQTLAPLAVTTPLRLLGMVAAPRDLAALDVTLEQQRVKQALQALQDRGIIELHWLPGQSWRDLQRAMRNGPWHIFHFIGHGSYDPAQHEGLLALADDQGQAHYCTATDLGRLLADHAALRLVLLNSCEGARGSERDLFASSAASLVRRGLPAVIAMQYAISDQAALEFAQTFYESLADNWPVDAAACEARKAMAIAANHSLEWGTPVLYMHAADGQLFNVQKITPPSLSPPPQLLELQAAEQTPEPDEPALTARSARPVMFDWVTVPAGEFWLGSERSQDPQAFANEHPQHRLTLPAYQVARTPVTVAQFAAFIQATGYQTTAEIHGQALVGSGKPAQAIAGADWAHPHGPQSSVAAKADHPVTCVSWLDAVAFCQWAGVRLPSEAEWEKAARGCDGQLFPWGNEQPQANHCNFAAPTGDTTAVGRYPANVSPYGVQEMGGNVWEWTNSQYARYPYSQADGREDPTPAGNWVLRGGAFGEPARNLRSACRKHAPAAYASNSIGFRVVALDR